MMGTCLVVDDETDVERLIRQRFRHEIREGQLTFLFAHDGEEAIDVLKDHLDIDMVLTDINMPRMDGLTLLGHIQDINPIARTIVVSAYGDMDNIRTSMNKGAFDFIIKPINFEDLRATMDKTLGFVSQIKESLSQSRENNILRMYVNPSIVHFLADQPGPAQQSVSNMGHNRRINASVMFVDICSFTKLSETLSPNLIAHLLNTYFDEIAQEALSFGGTIDKFIGDAAMIVFEDDDHLGRAVESALGIMKRLGAFAGTELGEGSNFPGVSIGIHTGEMISGNFGSKSIKRLDFTVIGDTVNTASRLENVAKDGQILVAAETVDLLKGRFECATVGQFVVKNKSQALDVYNVSSRKT